MGSPEGYGLDPTDWCALLAQAALLRSVASELGELYELADRTSIAGSIGQLGLAANHGAATDSDPAGALKVAADRWCERLAEDSDTPGIGHDERELMRRLREKAGKAAANDPFDALFAAITERSAAAYEASWVTCELRVCTIDSHPRPTADPYAVTGRIPSSEPQCVEVIVHRDGLGPATWSALPYVILHECVCHVPARQGGVMKNTSAFAEGFMDWAADWFHDIWIEGIDDALAPAARVHGPGLRQLFMNPRVWAGGGARREGSRAAARLVSWVVTDRDLPTEAAKAWVAHLAVELNVRDRRLADKDALVALLLHDYPFGDGLTALLGRVLDKEVDPVELIDYSASAL